MNNNQPWVNQQVRKSPLLEKRELVDKNMRSYLVLRLEDLNGVFVFHSQVAENRWIDLTAGKEYNFTIAENDKGYWNLLDFDYV